MSYKWKPSKTQRRAFAERMNDPAEKAAYYERKESKAVNRRKSSAFDYQSAGGQYIPTKIQYDFCMVNNHLFSEPAQQEACNMVIYGYNCGEKVHHDFIHIVNTMIRKSQLA